MNQPLVFGDKYEESVERAFDWYAARSEPASRFLLECIKNALEKVAQNPYLFQVKKRNFRHVVLSPFPYVLIYKIRKNEVFIFKIFHTSRNPKKKFK